MTAPPETGGTKQEEPRMAPDPDPAAPETEPADPPEPTPTPEPTGTGDAPATGDRLPDDHPVVKALKKANEEAAAARKKVKEYEDQGKSETQRLNDDLAAQRKRADEAETKALRLEVAAAKGLNAAQAKRLVGSTREELEQDADEILEAFPAAAPSGGGGESGGATPPPTKKPSPDLKGGTDPTTPGDRIDPAKLAEAIPRP